MEFRTMRRAGQSISQKEQERILAKHNAGVLALSGDGGYPYTVPLNYVYEDGKIYFHGANQGHKADAIRSCEQASFCVIDSDMSVPEEYTTYFRSVIAFGRIRFIEDKQEMYKALEKLAGKYRAGVTAGEKPIDVSGATLGVMEFVIEHMTGKEARALSAARKETAL